MSVLQFGYECPECGGRMFTKALLTSPPINVAKCDDCGAVYQRPMYSDKPAALPSDFRRVGPQDK